MQWSYGLNEQVGWLTGEECSAVCLIKEVGWLRHNNKPNTAARASLLAVHKTSSPVPACS
jgi:hypothetical protein